MGRVSQHERIPSAQSLSPVLGDFIGSNQSRNRGDIASKADVYHHAVGVQVNRVKLYSQTQPIPLPQANLDDALVAVVDDEPSVRDGLVNLLESVGLQTRTFGSAMELLNAGLPERCRCFLVDIRLPGISGLEFQAHIAAANIPVPIVFMTGHADIPMAVKAMKAGAIDFLTKPFREQELLDAVTRAIELGGLRFDAGQRTTEIQARYETLSEREREVMRLIAAGLMNKQAAGKMGIALSTVKVHRGHVMRKMGARSLADLVRMAELLPPMLAHDFRAPHEAASHDVAMPTARFQKA